MHSMNTQVSNLKAPRSTSLLPRGVPSSSSRRPSYIPQVAAADVGTQPSGLQHLSEYAKGLAKKATKNKFEKVKIEKCGSTAFTDVFSMAAKVREGHTKWEDLNLDDVDIRLKWAGLFHRGKRTPGKFMMRLKIPSGEVNAAQLRTLAATLRPLGAEGCADITTRASLQLRGLSLDSADKVLHSLHAVGLSSFMSGMDNVRNLTGNPIAGVDPHELLDTRPLLSAINDMITNKSQGRADMCNLPRKMNICISSTRDDFPHTQINDIGYEAVKDPVTGAVAFNVVYGGYFSIKRNIMSLPADLSITQEQLVPFTEAVLKVFRDFGPRADRQQARLIWLIEAMGLEKWKETVAQYMGPGTVLRPAIKAQHEGKWERRDLMGVHPQKQPGMFFVGACVPAGRMQAEDLEECARIAETYGDGTLRMTCEENIIFVNVPKDKLQAMLKEPLLQKTFPVNPGMLTRGMVSCTGAQFCGFALAETKNRAIAYMARLEQELDIPRPVRMHFTGCPNSCGQAQVGDIGLMGAPAKVNGKAVEGFKIFLGGKIGEEPALAKEFAQGVPADEEHLLPKLREILITEFGATPKGSVPSADGLPPFVRSPRPEDN